MHPRVRTPSRTPATSLPFCEISSLIRLAALSVCKPRTAAGSDAACLQADESHKKALSQRHIRQHYHIQPTPCSLYHAQYTIQPWRTIVSAALLNRALVDLVAMCHFWTVRLGSPLLFDESSSVLFPFFLKQCPAEPSPDDQCRAAAGSHAHKWVGDREFAR